MRGVCFRKKRLLRKSIKPKCYKQQINLMLGGFYEEKNIR